MSINLKSGNDDRILFGNCMSTDGTDLSWELGIHNELTSYRQIKQLDVGVSPPDFFFTLITDLDPCPLTMTFVPVTFF